jgi:hypothetical protein
MAKHLPHQIPHRAVELLGSHRAPLAASHRAVRNSRCPLRRETTAKFGIAMKRPMAGWDNACNRTELGILMRLLGPLSHGLDATRARCYKSAHSIPEN